MRCSSLIVVGLVGVSLPGSSHASTEVDVPRLAEKCIPSVVQIVSMSEQANLGSGFVVSADGKIITNYHVVENAESVIVKFSDGSFRFVEGVVGLDSVHDLAVLKAEGHSLAHLSVGDSDSVRVGERVIAIGSPLSLETTVSDGIVSAIRKQADGTIFQITAPISPGSSGGVLLDTTGRAIGVTTAYIAEGQNLNFAVPINFAKSLLRSNEVVDLEVALLLERRRQLERTLDRQRKEEETRRLRDRVRELEDEVRREEERDHLAVLEASLPQRWINEKGEIYEIRITGDTLTEKLLYSPNPWVCNLGRKASGWSGTCRGSIGIRCEDKYRQLEVELLESVSIVSPKRLEGTSEAAHFDCDGKKLATRIDHWTMTPTTH